jgi:hypothetical protein
MTGNPAPIVVAVDGSPSSRQAELNQQVRHLPTPGNETHSCLCGAHLPAQPAAHHH